MAKKKKTELIITVIKTVKTNEPTGCEITRNNGDFTCTWKIGDSDYGSGQWFRYQVNNGTITAWEKIGGTVTSKTITPSNSPGSVKQITFWIKGQRKKYKKKSGKNETEYRPDVSGETPCTWTAEVPKIKSFSYSRTASNAGTFTWSVDTSGTDKAVFTRVELQTVTTRNNENPPKSWGAISNNGSSGSVSYTETLSGSNLVRWVRVRAVGPAGSSGWSTQRHAYGNPLDPSLLGASASVNGSSIRITANWDAPSDVLHPVETITIQYVAAVPTTTTLSAPSSGWTDVMDVAANGSDKVVANVSDSVDDDECLWVRLKATHDDSSSYSNARLAYTGKLKTPGIDATPNTSTGNVAISITKNTTCTAACTVIFYRSQKNPSYDQVMAVLPNNVTTTTIYVEEIKTSVSGHVTKTCFGAYAFVGSYTGTSVSARMTSGIALDSDLLAVAPAWLELSAGKKDDSVRIKWPWTWTDAVSAELAWADHDDAWESTDEPSNYSIEDKQIKSWVIAGLAVGKLWYFRVRLIGMDGDEDVIGPWSSIYSYNLSSIPDKPVLILNKSVVSAGESVTARWAYSSADETEQQYADICLATISGSTITYGSVIAHVGENQTVEISRTWTTGTTYYLCLRVTSTSGQQSSWSDPVSLYAAAPIQLSVQHSLTTDDGELYLKEMPLTATVAGAGAAGQTIVSIIRAENYHVYRPDDSDFDGFEGETIASIAQGGESQVSMTVDDLVGALDDGAKYILRCTAIDEYGQTKYADYQFTVAWTHQAGKPTAEVKIDEWQRIAIIKPIAPSNYVSGDVCDIYRISSDKPELVVKGAAFGTKYVDPFPAFGFHCGHRIVTRTANGDYITENNELAWFLADSDVGDVLEEDSMIIDVNGNQIELPYNIEMQNSWNKDFKRTTYLGGSVEGDWNPAVTRDLTANTVVLRGRDLDTQLAMRGLAGYAGPAHIRTPDGSSMTCDIQIRESWTYQSKRVSYSMVIKVVDPERPDGMTYDQWNSMNPAG